MIAQHLLPALHAALKVILGIISMVLFGVVLLSVYLLGVSHGVGIGKERAENIYSVYLSSLVKDLTETGPTPTPLVIVKETPPATQTPSTSTSGLLKNVSWGGPDLWNAVNSRRQQLGVNALDQEDDLCTIASIRLNELLELGTLDGHEGFSNMTERRPDLEHIFQNYSTVAEFLAAGGETANETVSLWENSLGHKKLLTGGEYVWGCIYAQNSFAVAITAF